MKSELFREKNKSIPVLNRSMSDITELEKIALEFGDLVKYNRVNPVLEDIDGKEFVYGTEREFLHFENENVNIHVSNDIGQNNILLSYWVDKSKLDYYILLLSKSKNKFIKDLTSKLKEIHEINKVNSKEDTEKLFVGEDIKVDSYGDLPELIRLNLEKKD